MQKELLRRFREESSLSGGQIVLCDDVDEHLQRAQHILNNSPGLRDSQMGRLHQAMLQVKEHLWSYSPEQLLRDPSYFGHFFRCLGELLEAAAAQCDPGSDLRLKDDAVASYFESVQDTLENCGTLEIIRAMPPEGPQRDALLDEMPNYLHFGDLHLGNMKTDLVDSAEPTVSNHSFWGFFSHMETWDGLLADFEAGGCPIRGIYTGEHMSREEVRQLVRAIARAGSGEHPAELIDRPVVVVHVTPGERCDFSFNFQFKDAPHDAPLEVHIVCDDATQGAIRSSGKVVVYSGNGRLIDGIQYTMPPTYSGPLKPKVADVPLMSRV